MFNPQGAIWFLLILLLPTMFKVVESIALSMIEIKQKLDPPTTLNVEILQKEPETKKKKKKKSKDKRTINEVFGLEKIGRQVETDEKIKENARKALIKLGFKARDARALLNKLCINKCYDNETELIQDCFRAE